jgi:uncharacterized protein
MTSEQNSDQDVREKNIKLIQSFLDLLEQKDLNAWINLWDEDGRQLNPYAPKGFRRVLSGKNTIFHHWGGVPNAYGRISFTHREMYPTLDRDVIYTEFCGEIEVLDFLLLYFLILDLLLLILCRHFQYIVYFLFCNEFL